MERLALRTILCCLLFVVIKGTTGQRSRCSNGWFGKNCRYQCHCLNGAVCDKTTGECPGVCDRGWFGPQCQYRDAAYSAFSLLTDGSDVTCLFPGELYQTFEMVDDVMFTWMRIVTNRPGLFDRVKMTFILSSGTKVDPKTALKKVYVSDVILELHGELQNRLKKIALEFDTPETKQSFCSMQVSSGRNVAIKQEAYQSSTYLFGTADKAVDGKPDRWWKQESCMHTDNDNSLFWTLNLSLPVTVNMYTLLARRDEFGGICRLNYFRLKSYNHSTKVQQYAEKNKVNQPRYDVYPVNTSPITSINLTVSKNFWPNEQYVCVNNIPALSFCEMQIFGDVVCPPGKYGRDCEKDCNCQDPSDACFISTGMCPSGCKAGFQGFGCQEECPDGRWGVDCLNSCDNCLDGKCNKSSGDCLSECLAGYKTPQCVENCDAGFHGFNCIQPCPANCQDNICDNVDGKCTKCVAGYQGLVCNQECDATFYGEDCATQCSDKCIDQLCHHITGVCDNCPEGKQISKDCSQDADQLNLVTILVPVILVLIVVAALIVGIWLWRKRKAQKANSRMVLNNENKDGPDVMLGHGVNLELEDTQPPNVPEETIDHYERISLNVKEGNPANNETENTSHYVNVESPLLNEYELTGENRESHVYTEPEDK